MSHFIESLERRSLLSTTTASLAAELTAVSTNAGPVKADLLALQSAAKADFKSVAADLKGLAKTNAPLFRKFQNDAGKWLAKVKTDTGALLSAVATSAHGVVDGDAVLTAPTKVSLQSKITADVTALDNQSINPLTRLSADISTTTLGADLDALISANPSNGPLATDSAKTKSDLNTLGAKLVSDAGTFSTSVGGLAADLQTLGPAPTTSPSLVGDYKGNFKTKAILFGIGSTKLDFEMKITSQTIDSVTGTITIAGQSASGTITAKELSNGHVSLAINNSGFTISLNGTVNVSPTAKGLAPGSVINGSGSVSIAGFSVDGSFTATRTT